MKRIILLLFTSLFLLCSCELTNRYLSLSQPVEHIKRIDLMIDESGVCLPSEEHIAYTFEDESISLFLPKILNLKLHKRTHPAGEYGYLRIRIQYHNGDIDLFGSSACCTIISGETLDNGWYYFSYNALYDLFSEYVEIGELSDIPKP